MRTSQPIPPSAASVFAGLAATNFTPMLTRVLTQLEARVATSLPRALGGALYKGLQRILKKARSFPTVPTKQNWGPQTPSVFLPPVLEAAWSRAAQEKVILALHDTTECRFGGNKRRPGLGRLNKNDQGFLAHVCLGVSADGRRIPMGVLGFEALVRSEENVSGQSALARYQSPDKESLRWLRGIRHVQASADAAKVQVIHVTDREGDDYETFASQVVAKCRYVIRLRQDRILFQEQGAPAGPHKVSNAFSQALSGDFVRDVNISERAGDGRKDKSANHPARSQRAASLTFQATTLALQRPGNASKKLPRSIHVNVVRAFEKNPPNGEEPVEWMLVTSEPIASVEQVLFVVDAYRARWTIEEFFKAIKTGCSFERLQLDGLSQLISMMCMFFPIATKMLLLRTLERVTPEAPAAQVLDEDHMEVLRQTGHRKLSAQPDCRELMRAVAAMGGFLGGPKKKPGWLVLARGLETLMERTVTWRAAREYYASGKPRDPHPHQR